MLFLTKSMLTAYDQNICSNLVKKKKWAWLISTCWNTQFNQKLQVNCSNTSKTRRNRDSLISLLAAFRPYLLLHYKLALVDWRISWLLIQMAFSLGAFKKGGLAASGKVSSVFLNRTQIYCVTWGNSLSCWLLHFPQRNWILLLFTVGIISAIPVNKRNLQWKIRPKHYFFPLQKVCGAWLYKVKFKTDYKILQFCFWVKYIFLTWLCLLMLSPCASPKWR